MSKQNIAALVAALLCSLLLTGIVLANGTTAIDWQVIGSGGRHTEVGIYSLDNTIGQAVVGTFTDTDTELCSGFWCSTSVENNIYLPLVTRND